MRRGQKLDRVGNSDLIDEISKVVTPRASLRVHEPSAMHAFKRRSLSRLQGGRVRSTNEESMSLASYYTLGTMVQRVRGVSGLQYHYVFAKVIRIHTTRIVSIVWKNWGNG